MVLKRFSVYLIQMELQADYEACLEELRSMDRDKDVLIFQLDRLHDDLEGAEETLAETQRENKQLVLV